MSTESRFEHLSPHEQLTRRIDSDKKQIKKLLDGLESKLEDKPLKQSHNSVMTSFTLMLAYIDEIRKSIPEGDIKILLQTYRGMAELFYIKFEYSLLKEITKQREVYEQSKAVIEYIEQLPKDDPGIAILKTVNPILAEDRDAADIEYKSLIENFPTLLQKALDKLRDEWQRIDAIAVANQVLAKDKDFIEILRLAVYSAATLIGINAKRIAIVPGDNFSLSFFAYLENLTVLTVPLYSVRSPWEWSIFWHELAGYKVRQLEKNTATMIASITENLTLVQARYKELIHSDEYYRKYFLKSIMQKDEPNEDDNQSLVQRKNIFCQNYLSQLLSNDELDLSELGGFEYQFERILENLPKENKIQIYKQMMGEGWCVDWFKELFEDAWSVMAIREPFVDYFEDILRRKGAKGDHRHPPLEIRLSVARELLKLMESESEMIPPPVSVEESAAQQILKFMALLFAGVKDTKSMPDNRLYLINTLPNIVANRIGNYIIEWKKGLIEYDSVQMVENYFNEFFSNTLVGEAGYNITLDLMEDKLSDALQPRYEEMLRDKDYKELLGLSFFERDYLSSDGITNVFYNAGGVASRTAKFLAIKCRPFTIDASNLLVTVVTSSDQGIITFDHGTQKWATSLRNWNLAFPEDNLQLPDRKDYHIKQ